MGDKDMRRNPMRGLVLFAGALVQLTAAGNVWSQTTPAAEPSQQQLEEVIVTGTDIRGNQVATALPVVTVDMDQIAATGANGGGDLFRSIPQMADVPFEAANNPQTSNSARGDELRQLTFARRLSIRSCPVAPTSRSAYPAKFPRLHNRA
jgi:iron complex outermembrane receptor protein